jgi:hypothetical protein
MSSGFADNFEIACGIDGFLIGLELFEREAVDVLLRFPRSRRKCRRCAAAILYAAITAS